MPTFAAFALAALCPQVPAEPASVPLLGFPLAPAADGALALDAAAHAALAGVPRARLVGTPFPGFEGLVLDVVRAPLATRDSVLSIDGEVVARGPEALLGGLTLWTGRVADEADSHVFLAFSENGSRGWIRAGGELVHLLAEPGPDGTWSEPRARLASEAALAALRPERGFRCDVLEPPASASQVAGTVGARAVPESALAGTAAVPLYELRVALETDWQFYTVFNDAGAAATYALSLFGAVSDAYRRDVDLVLTIPYLGLYTSNNDPWDAQDFGFGSVDVLYEFQDTWKTSGWPVEADLAHLISGAGLGGGVAWLDVLCVADYGYAVSGNLHGQTPFPVAQGPLSWDFVVTAHETGHNVVTHHTHNYCPPIDECAPDGYWGPCQDEVVCVEGTIMSYCHICNELGMANVRPEFHPIVQDALRARVEDSCLQPFTGVFTTDLGHGLAGSGPAPALGIAWDDAPGPAFQVAAYFDGAPHPQVGVLVVGGTQIDLSVFGGTLVPSPDLFQAFPVAAGHVDLAPFAFAGGFPGGAVAYAQGWFTDPGGPEGLAASNALAVELHAPDAPAPLAWFPHPTNGLEYAVGPAKTWLAGRGLAEQHGGDLAAVGSAALETWLKTQFFDSGLVAGDAYIGYTDAFSEGSFHWSSGAGGLYSHWAPGEPNDYDGFEDCAAWVGGGAWNDTHGYDLHPALYERPIGTRP